jgi:hypothetical protein
VIFQLAVNQFKSLKQNKLFYFAFISKINLTSILSPLGKGKTKQPISPFPYAKQIGTREMVAAFLFSRKGFAPHKAQSITSSFREKLLSLYAKQTISLKKILNGQRMFNFWCTKQTVICFFRTKLFLANVFVHFSGLLRIKQGKVCFRFAASP